MAMISKLSIGIVGLPNAGKSTLFNALMGRHIADNTNYPFCTIEPNVGVVEVPDEKLDKLCQISESQKRIAAVVEFVDIAGLIAGASKGEGLGNKFLDNIRNCDAICHVVRNFTDPAVIRSGSTDPQSDFEVVCTELILKDLESIDKFIDKNKMVAEEKDRLAVAVKLKENLDRGILASRIEFDKEEKELVGEFFLLSLKPFFIVVNVDEDTHQNLEKEKLRLSDWDTVPICAKIEEDLADFDKQEKKDYLKSLGIEEAGLERVIKKAYDTLGLQSFYTTGKKESRAWTIKKSYRAPQAAGVIHTDFERGFIMAEVISFDQIIEIGSWNKAKELGKIRHEDSNYEMRPDDVVEFRFNVSK